MSPMEVDEHNKQVAQMEGNTRVKKSWKHNRTAASDEVEASDPETESPPSSKKKAKKAAKGKENKQGEKTNKVVKTSKVSKGKGGRAPKSKRVIVDSNNEDDDWQY